MTNKHYAVTLWFSYLVRSRLYRQACPLPFLAFLFFPILSLLFPSLPNPPHLFSSPLPFWCTRHWTAFHHSTWRMTVNSSQPLAAGDFDRLMLLPATSHEPAQLWAIDPSLLLVHICGTIYHFIFVTLNYRFPSFAGYWKRICLAEDRGA